jgi:tetratricopeptide (TPR) repeat protein
MSELAPSMFGSAALGFMEGETEALAGDLESAASALRRSCDELTAAGERSYLSTGLAQIAMISAELNRDDEALRLADESEAAASSDDVASQGYLRLAKAKVLSGRGDAEPAERLAKEAVALTETTDFRDIQGIAKLWLGEILRAANRPTEAAEAIARGLAAFEQKGNVVRAERARALLAELAPA